MKPHSSHSSHSSRVGPEQGLERHQQRLSILNQAAQALLANVDTGIALDAIYERIAACSGIDAFIELGVNPKGTVLELQAIKLIAGATRPSTMRRAVGQGIAGKVAQTRKPVVLANVQASSDPDLVFVKELGAQAYACEPLVVGDRLIGTLSFASSRRTCFDLEDQEFFQTLANCVALAREKLRLGKELQQHSTNLEQAVRERTAQLVEANANLQEFAHMVAHDLRSPLRTINSFATLASDECGQQFGPEGQFYLWKVAEGAEKMGKLLNDLLEYAQLNQTELKLERVELSTALKEALTLLQEEIRGKRAKLTIAKPLPSVLGHRATVILVINNFVSNALKFVPEGVHPQIRIAAELSGEFTRLLVEDNGIGIEPKDHVKLFQLFQQLHGKNAYPGTGLGLAIVRRAVERMGGQVGFKSEPGKGSCFWAEFIAPKETAHK